MSKPKPEPPAPRVSIDPRYHAEVAARVEELLNQAIERERIKFLEWRAAVDDVNRYSLLMHIQPPDLPNPKNMRDPHTRRWRKAELVRVLAEAGGVASVSQIHHRMIELRGEDLAGSVSTTHTALNAHPTLFIKQGRGLYRLNSTNIQQHGDSLLKAMTPPEPKKEEKS